MDKDHFHMLRPNFEMNNQIQFVMVNLYSYQFLKLNSKHIYLKKTYRQLRLHF